MIIFLYGQDSYRMREKLSEIVQEYKKANEKCLDLSFFDCHKKTGNAFGRFKDGLCQTSMFKEKKLIILTNPLSEPDFKEKFSKEKKSFLDSSDIIVFFQEADFNKKDSLFNFLKKNSKTQEFELLQGLKLRNWVVKRFNNSKIDQKAVGLLLEYVGSDLWRMKNEIQKLIDYKKDGMIEEKDVRLQVKSNINTDIFKTIDAVAERRKDKALKFLQKHIEKGDSPLYLMSMINYQFRNLLTIKDLAEKSLPYNVILKKSGLHPFVVKKTYSQSRFFSLQDLKKIYHKIFKTDLKIKTGRINPEIGLELLIAEI